MPWFTDTQLTALPAFAGLDPDGIAQLAADAGRLYRYVGQNPGVADPDLRSWAEGAGIPPERYNRAAEALRQSGRAVAIDDGPLVSPPSAAPAPTLASLAPGDSIPTDKLLEKDLRAVAKRLGLDVPKSATKAEIAEAISRA